MSISSKIRMALVGLTAVALIGGVMGADPADAGKKRKKIKKAKITKVVQVNRGGDARGGNAGSGGRGGDSGKVANTGNVGGGPVTTIPAFVADPAVLECLFGELPALPGVVIDAGELAGCLALGAENPLFRVCLVEALPAITLAELAACIDRFDDPVVVGPVGGGAVFSGDGGAGGDGGDGGDAQGGDASNNTQTVTITKDDHAATIVNGH